jgi:hypothetical protein
MRKHFKGLRARLSNRKGIMIVWLALFLLPLLLIFLGLAVDMGYMYFVKNQLQVAADAAALAGAAKLDPGDPTTLQTDARREAWKFACKNSAAGQPVFLATSSSTDCDSPPGGGLNEGNDANGEIFVGHWDGSDCVSPQTGEEVDCVRAVARRPGDAGAATMPSVRVFVGQIFRLIGVDWSFLQAGAAATAIAAPAPILPIAVNEYWLSGRPNPTRPYDAIHDYPNSFVRQTNVNGTASTAWGRIFAILGGNASDNRTPAMDMNGYVFLDARTSNHTGENAPDGTGTWWDIIPAVANSAGCGNCGSAFSGPTIKKTGAIVQDKFDESLQYLHEGYDYILPTAVREEFRVPPAVYPVTSNYPLNPTSSCSYATVPYFSGVSSLSPLDFNGKEFWEDFPPGSKIVTLVYDGTFMPDADPSMANVVTNVGYVLLQIDGYASGNPDDLVDPDFLAAAGPANTAYAHAISDIVQPAGTGPGVCDPSFIQAVRDLQMQGRQIRLVK